MQCRAIPEGSKRLAFPTSMNICVRGYTPNNIMLLMCVSRAHLSKYRLVIDQVAVELSLSVQQALARSVPRNGVSPLKTLTFLGVRRLQRQPL